MALPFSVDDAFTVGVSFDLIGGYLLGRGLLTSPSEIAIRTTHVPLMDQMINAPEAVAQIESWADAIGGLTALAVGFLTTGLTDEGIGDLAGYAREYFGVERMAQRYPPRRSLRG